jgi:hypothetical protein
MSLGLCILRGIKNCRFAVVLLAVMPWHAVAVRATDELFVTNGNTNSVTVYSRAASGNAAPLRTLSGAATALNSPGTIDIDTVNNEFAVPNSNANTVTMYTRTASGNTAPLRTLAGAATGLSQPLAVHIDAVNSELAVANANGETGRLQPRHREPPRGGGDIPRAIEQ